MLIIWASSTLATFAIGQSGPLQLQAWHASKRSEKQAGFRDVIAFNGQKKIVSKAWSMVQTSFRYTNHQKTPEDTLPQTATPPMIYKDPQEGFARFARSLHGEGSH